jgi:HPt (histidine-containing phosphotransfer) domain-containing protein
VAAPVFDPTVLAGLPMVADGSEPEYAEEVLDVFRDGAHRALDEIDAAARLGDTKTLLLRVHTLKSSCAAVGAMALAEAAARQEDLLRSGQLPAAESPRRLREEYTQFERAVQRHRAADVAACEST